MWLRNFEEQAREQGGVALSILLAYDAASTRTLSILLAYDDQLQAQGLDAAQ